MNCQLRISYCGNLNPGVPFLDGPRHRPMFVRDLSPALPDYKIRFCLLRSLPPNSADLTIIGVYFVATILVGWLFRRKAYSSSEFFHAARTLPTPVTAIAFLAANCGALEIVGIVSVSAKYGAETLHFYWVGAIPAMLFLALAMMPIYMRSRALTVPEFLTLR
jgi:solute:Na+ symporter, SSS family